VNREETGKAIATMLAYTNGAKIEVYCEGVWKETIDPQWSHTIVEYRVKTKPLECFVWYDADGKAYAARNYGWRENLDEPVPVEGGSIRRMVEPL